jgi:hypothetical protein
MMTSGKRIGNGRGARHAPLKMMLWNESGLRLSGEHAVVEMTDRKRCGVVRQ